MLLVSAGKENMEKEKELKKCKTDCIEYINGDCKLKIKDDNPTETSKANLGSLCGFYRKVKVLEF